MISAQQRTDKIEVIAHLTKLRREYFEAIVKGLSPEQAKTNMGKFIAMTTQVSLKGTFLTIKGIEAASILADSG
jgi:hypothetical protein